MCTIIQRFCGRGGLIKVLRKAFFLFFFLLSSLSLGGVYFLFGFSFWTVGTSRHMPLLSCIIETEDRGIRRRRVGNN